MRYPRIGSMDHRLTLLVLVSSILNVGAEFYIGEYQTASSSSPLSSSHHSSRNPLKEKQPVLHLDDNDDDRIDDGQQEEDEASNELVGDVGRSLPPSAKRRQAVGFSTFNPLTPGGTIYLAFIFLIPLTVGKNLGRRRSGSSKTAGLLERLVHKVQQDQQSLYSEMGYVDGNLMLRKAWRDVRHNLAQRLLPWRSRHDNEIDQDNHQNKKKEKKTKKRPKKKRRNKWKPWTS